MAIWYCGFVRRWYWDCRGLLRQSHHCRILNWRRTISCNIPLIPRLQAVVRVCNLAMTAISVVLAYATGWWTLFYQLIAKNHEKSCDISAIALHSTCAIAYFCLEVVVILLVNEVLVLRTNAQWWKYVLINKCLVTFLYYKTCEISQAFDFYLIGKYSNFYWKPSKRNK